MSERRTTDVAIVGFGAVLPGSTTADAFWRLVSSARDAITEPPADRWILDPARAFDPHVGRADRAYTTRGGFVEDEPVDVDGLDVDPALVARLDPSFRLALRTAVTAWRAAKTESVDRGRAGLIFGNIILPTETTSSLTREMLGRTIEQAVGAPPSSFERSTDEPLNAFPAGLPASLVAKALGLGGPAFTLDAACASSLYALKLACDELTAGRADAMLAGGVSRPDPLYTQMGFSQLRALSPRGRSAPFDDAGDGLIVGEGAGLFVLKRLEDAVAHGDVIHGVIRGIGLSNDLHGDLLAPSSEGQLRAMRAAYEQAGWSPCDVDLVECHATGTPVGDAVEVESLKALWSDQPAGPSGRCVIGSVKSNVGHMLTAAGAAGLLKVLLAIERKVLPPTANHTETSPRLGLDQSPFRVLKAAEPWPSASSGRPRRAAISGFGFGGINAHVLVEEWTGRPAAGESRLKTQASPVEPIAIVGVSARFGPWRGRSAFQHRVLEGGESTSESDRLIDDLRLRLGRFRIPPRELEAMLLQQSLMLETAADAIEDAGGSAAVGLRTCVVVGLGLDLNATNFQLRWWLTARAPVWNAELGWNLAPPALDAWIAEACDAVLPALSPNRTMGSLGGLVASRIAREFRIGGPSFTVSSDEDSGLDALRLAADWLARGEVDSAVVGAVDLAGDVRTARAARLLHAPESLDVGEGASALVLKRRADAVRDGDRIYAVIADPSQAENRAVVLDSVRSALGWTGAAEGLAAVAAAAVALDQSILPRSAGDGAAIGPRYWLRNRDDGPRIALVRQRALGGREQTVALESVDDAPRSDRRQPLGPHPRAIFAIAGDDPAGRAERLAKLERLAGEDPARPIETLARLWRQAGREESAPSVMAMIAGDAGALARAIRAIHDDVERARPVDRSAIENTGVEVFTPRRDWDVPPRVALTYPGLGNVFAGMGSRISALWPELLDELERRFATVRDQFAPDVWWNGPLPSRYDDHRPAILGQIAVGALTTSLFQKLGVKPDAALGYSLGESAALVALGAWPDRDDMFKRLMASPLFATELAGPCSTARRAWGLDESEPVDWVAGIVPRSGDEVESAIGDGARVYVLIRNAADECVIGGQGDAVRGVLHALRCPLLPLPLVSTVHCAIGRDVEPAYRALHDLPTARVEGVSFYSGVWGTAYAPDHGTAAAAITAQAARVIDYPRVVEQAYADGVRVFLEMGPGSSCTRLIGRILGDRPHVAVSACPADGDALDAVLRALGELIAAGVSVDLGFLYDRPTEDQDDREAGARREIVIERDRRVIGRPSPPPVVPTEEADGPSDFASVRELVEVFPSAVVLDEAPMTSIPPIAPRPTLDLAADGPSASSSPLLRQFLETQLATSRAHEAFLRTSQGFSESMGRRIALEFDLLGGGAPVEAPPAPPAASRAAGVESVALDRAQCLEFAIGSIGAVLGPAYAEIDSHPTRVRLPDEPLMLVDRIVTIEGALNSLTSGRVVTEHDVLHDGWYLDGGRIAPCIAIESGQADLFLAGYLGIDLITKGLAVYRLLDATVTFHRSLPGPGEVIRYDITISSFFRQGETHLFRFGYKATVNGEPLLTMRDGCAGFFSEAALAGGKGIVPRPLDSQPRPGVRPDDWRDLAPASPTTLDARQVDALRAGDLGAAFGSPFDRLALADPLPLPGGRMTLVHRVKTLDLRGGRFGLGLIQAEADIHPDDWFMVCHFVDDRVMPGTLMYECCQHTLRILLMRLGWVGSAESTRYEPQTDVANRLRCRGQVVETTRVVTYEITIKELGYGPEPYAIADALMYADGRPIVEFTDMGLRLAGTTRAELERLWDDARRGEVEPRAPQPSGLVYTSEQILAFSAGAPSECFGARFRPFDAERFIARLPRPPYQFLDRVTILEGEPCVQAVGVRAEADYTVPPDAWYFESDRQPLVPFAVLLEAVLQACGFVSAFMGSALTSDGPLKYRNLGGRGRQLRLVDRNSGTLRSSVRVVKINRSAGMLLHHFEMTIHDASGLVYEGDTYFGFFHPDALIDQVGVREAVPHEPTADERRLSRSFPVPDDAPFPDRRWRMVDQVDLYVPQGGPHGLGFIEGSVDVDPGAWFFEAHFLGDPVWPGSLGLESMLQLLKVVAAERWGVGPNDVFESPGLNVEHRWTYRGQIASTNRRVTTQAVVTAVDDDQRLVTADGLLRVDGKVIYQMHGFTLGLRSR